MSSSGISHLVQIIFPFLMKNSITLFFLVFEDISPEEVRFSMYDAARKNYLEKAVKNVLQLSFLLKNRN